MGGWCASSRGSGIARGTEEFGVGPVAPECPAEGVLAAAASDDEDPHDFCALRNASPAALGGLAGRVGDLARHVADFARVVVARVLEVVLERTLLRLAAAADVLAAEDPLVGAAGRPTAAAPPRAPCASDATSASVFRIL